jgi:hypothetical protein
MTRYDDFMADVRFRAGLADTEVARSTATVLCHRVLVDDHLRWDAPAPEIVRAAALAHWLAPGPTPVPEAARWAIEVALGETPDRERYLTETVVFLLSESEPLLWDEEVVDLLRHRPYLGWDLPRTVHSGTAAARFDGVRLT